MNFPLSSNSINIFELELLMKLKELFYMSSTIASNISIDKNFDELKRMVDTQKSILSIIDNINQKLK